MSETTAHADPIIRGSFEATLTFDGQSQKRELKEKVGKVTEDHLHIRQISETHIYDFHQQFCAIVCVC